MRTKEELENVIKVVQHYREILPEYNLFGENNWHKYDTELYYLNHVLNHDILPPLNVGDADISEVCEIHEWLEGYDGTDFYSEMLEELEDIK